MSEQEQIRVLRDAVKKMANYCADVYANAKLRGAEAAHPIAYVMAKLGKEALAATATIQPGATPRPGQRELGEVITYAIGAYKKDMPVEKIFTLTPTDANGYMGAYIAKAIEHHRPATAPEPFGYLIDIDGMSEQFVKAHELAPEHGMRAKSVTELYTAAPAQGTTDEALPVIDVWVDPNTMQRSLLDHGTPLAPSDKREFVGSLVWSSDPRDAPLNPGNVKLRAIAATGEAKP